MQARVHARDQRLLQPCVRAWHELTTPCANIRGPRIPLHKCACARRFTHLVARVNSYVARNLVALLDFFFPLSFLFFFFLFFFFSFFFALIFFPFSLDLSPFPHRSISSPCLQAFSFYDAKSRLFFLSFLYLFATLFYLFLFSLAPSFSF